MKYFLFIIILFITSCSSISLLKDDVVVSFVNGANDSWYSEKRLFTRAMCAELPIEQRVRLSNESMLRIARVAEE